MGLFIPGRYSIVKRCVSTGELLTAATPAEDPALSCVAVIIAQHQSISFAELEPVHKPECLAQRVAGGRR